jgi:hypothetical protein
MQGTHDRVAEHTAGPTRAVVRRFGWIVPAAILSTGLVTIQYWMPDPFSKQRAAELRIIDTEHGMLCQKWGFQLSSDQFAVCKVDLLKLRTFHKSMEIVY